MGRMDGEGDSTGRRARGRSSRQLLGHCLPGVCSSVISQPLPSLASYRHTHAHTHTHTHTHRCKCNPPTHHGFRFVQLLPSPVSLSASSVLRISGAGQIHWGSDFIYRYSDLMPASPSRFLFDGLCLAPRGGNVTQKISRGEEWNSLQFGTLT